jgi:outer membrane protein
MRELRAEVRMTVPIPTGVPQSKVRVAEQQKAQATFGRQKAQLDVREAIVKAWSNHETSLKNMNQYQVEVKAAEQSFEGAKEEYALGLKSVIDLAIIQAKLLQAKLQLISARQSVIIAKAQIQSILGRLLTKILKIAVHEYNPDMTNTWFGIKE